MENKINYIYNIGCNWLENWKFIDKPLPYVRKIIQENCIIAYPLSSAIEMALYIWNKTCCADCFDMQTKA